MGCRGVHFAITPDTMERLLASRSDDELDDAAVEGISTAVKKGMDLKAKSEQEVEDRKGILLEITEKINDLSGRLEHIREMVD